jgi:RNA polymerase sigma-70 factor (sigma-E family)
MDKSAGELTREEVGRRYVAGREDLFRIAWLMVADVGEAEDLVQEAYTRVMVHPERIRDPDRLDSYLRSIVLNQARSRWATRTRRRRLDERSQVDPTGLTRESESDPMQVADDRDLIRSALLRLTTKQRACVVCRYWLGFSDGETADATGLALGTVKTHLRRALSTLRTELNPIPTSTPEETHVSGL